MPSSLYVIPFRIRVSPSVTDTSTAKLGVAAIIRKSGDQGVHDHVSLLSKGANARCKRRDADFSLRDELNVNTLLSEPD
jgi:hypothetical protein